MLGKLRQLPLADDSPGADGSPPAAVGREGGLGRRAAFVTLGLVATASLLIASFCWIRWSLIEVAVTTDIHIETLRQEYHQVPAAQLIREYEDMEKYGLDLPTPYKYKQIETNKKSWGRNASIWTAIGSLSLIGCIALGVTGRRKQADT